jgi:hypothetical protein
MKLSLPPNFVEKLVWVPVISLEIMTGRLVPSAGQKIPVEPGWYLPPQKIRLAENRFLQAGKGAENTKEKSRQSFTE